MTKPVENVASKLHRNPGLQSSFSPFLCSFTLTHRALLLHAVGSGKSHLTEELGMQAEGEISGKRLTTLPPNSQRRNFAICQTWELKEAPLLRAQAASGGHCIPSERLWECQNQTVHILMRYTLQGRWKQKVNNKQIIVRC